MCLRNSHFWFLFPLTFHLLSCVQFIWIDGNDIFFFVFFFFVFQQGDSLPVKVNKLSSTKTQLPYDYYYLNYCKPKKINNNAENLGEVLRGDRIENSVYTVSILPVFRSNLNIVQILHLKWNYCTLFIYLSLMFLNFSPVQNEGGTVLYCCLQGNSWCWLCKEF